MSVHAPKSDRDRYLRLASFKHLVDTRPEVLRYVDTIRKASEWRLLGFIVDVSEYGNPERSDALEYRFFLVNERDPVVQEAIATGRRAVVHPLAVFEYFRIGCSLSEFVGLPPDVPIYCRARKHYEQNELAQALPLLEQACALNPDEVRYREVLYPLRLALGDMKSIAEELEYFKGDIDSMVHTGRAKEWLRALRETGDHAAREQIILQVEAAFVALCSGQSSIRRYGVQRPEWYRSSHETFRKLATASGRRSSKRENASRASKAEA
jgi:hypothetical protein